MATYVYETIPASAEDAVERFEIQQSMMEDPLQVHPDTGKPVRRVIVGGYLSSGGSASASTAMGGGGGGGC